MMMKKRIFTGLFAASAASAAFASISVSLDLESIRSQAGADLPNSGVAVLVVSTQDNSFALPQAGSLVTGDDEVVAMFDLSDSSISTDADAFALLQSAIQYGSSWSEDDALGLYWYPNMDINNPVPTASEAYGFYRDQDGAAGGDAWSLPGDGALLHSLKFFTADADDLVANGSVPAQLGYADFGVGGSIDNLQTPTSVLAGGSTPGAALVEWTGTLSQGAFRIERREEGSSDFDIVGFTSGSSSSYLDETAQIGKTYEYRLVAMNGFDAEFSSASELYTVTGVSRSLLVNISTRGLLGSGAEKLVPGFVIEGDGEKTVLARVVGPGLEAQAPGIFNTATDPSASLKAGQTELQENDNWYSNPDVQSLRDAATQVGGFPLPEGGADAALLNSMGEGAYTVTTGNTDPDNRVALVEVYDMYSGDPSEAENRLVNISTRGLVGQGPEKLVGGFAIAGTTPMRLLIRGLGPWLANFFPGQELSDPELLLYNGAGTQINQNDNWDSADTAEMEQIAQPLEADSNDAAFFVTLDPGSYTVHLRGVNNVTGIGLLEIFEVPEGDL